MTLLNSIRNVALFTSCVAILGGTLPAAAYAELIVFQFQTTIDARPAGGQADERLLVTYAFDSNLQIGTGEFGGNDTLIGSYGPIAMMTIQVGDQMVAVAGPRTSMTVFNNNGSQSGIHDRYTVLVDLAENDAQNSVTGTLFGMKVNFFGLVLFNNDALMFDSTALPVSPVFAGLADFQQVDLELVVPGTGGELVVLEVFESPTTPTNELIPFSLTFADPISALVVEVFALELPDGLENSLLRKLFAADRSVTAANRDAAIGQLQAFIDEVDAASGKRLTPQEADDLAGVAEAGILGLLAGG